MLKRTFASIAALTLAASPVLAQATAGRAVPQPASEAAEGSEMYRGGFILPTLGVIAVILVILYAADTWPFDDDEPASP